MSTSLQYCVQPPLHKGKGSLHSLFVLSWFVVLNYVCACVRAVLGQVGAFSVLKELVIVLPDSLSDHVGSLVPGIERALNVSAGRSMELSSWLT
jgi:hypothetical protein